MKRNTIKKVNALNKTKFLSFYEAEYENKKGEDKTWMIATRKKEEELQEMFFNNKEDKDDAVVVCALHKPSNKLVMIRQFRIPVNDYVYELTAGLIDEGETVASTAERELMEETGLKLIKTVRNKIGSKLYLSPGMTDESVTMVFCTCEGTINTENLEADECIEPMLISREGAAKILGENKKMDIKCFLVLQSFVTLGEKLFEE